MKAINRKYKNLKKENREKRKKYKFRIYSSRNNKNKEATQESKCNKTAHNK
jgi:hypothetical protein